MPAAQAALCLELAHEAICVVPRELPTMPVLVTDEQRMAGSLLGPQPVAQLQPGDTELTGHLIGHDDLRHGSIVDLRRPCLTTPGSDVWTLLAVDSLWRGRR